MNIKRFMRADSPGIFLATRIYASASSEERTHPTQSGVYLSSSKRPYAKRVQTKKADAQTSAFFINPKKMKKSNI